MPDADHTLLAKSIDIADFNFDIDKSRINALQKHDACVTIRRPGKNRKTAHHELILIPYLKKYKLKFKTVAIGNNSHGKKPIRIIIFDQPDLTVQSAVIRKYSDKMGLVNSKGHALKLLEIFDIPAPKKPNAITKVFFRLHPTLVKRNKFNYRICTLSVLRIVTEGAVSEALKKKNKKKKLKNAGTSNRFGENKEQSIIL